MKNICWFFLWVLCATLFHDPHILFAQQYEKSTTHTIREIPSDGIVITKPGTYVFEHDLTWHPVADGVAITIQANDVTLNMQGHTLRAVRSDLKTTGIASIGGVNLNISDGTVKGMGLFGIQCTGSFNVHIKNIVVDGLHVKDTVTYTVPVGILASGCLDVAIEKCTVKNICVRTGSCAAFQITKTLRSKITHCQVKNLLNEDGACTGIGHLECDEAVVRSCRIEKLRSKFIDNLNTEGHTAIGIIPVLTTNLKIEKCSISHITGCCDDAHGMSIFICDKAVVKRCRVFHVIDGVGKEPGGAKATGIEVYASDVKVIDCHVKKITAINPEDKQSTGFSCALCKNVQFIRCTAENINVVDEKGQQNPLLGYGTGFGWAPDPRPEFVAPAENVLYRHCVAKHCQVGFDAWFHINCLWDHVISKDNKIPVLNVETAQRTLSCGPCSECGCHQAGCFPVPYVVTINNVAHNNQFRNLKIR